MDEVKRTIIEFFTRYAFQVIGALIIFGAGKLPEIGAGLGKGIKNFKKATNEPLESLEKTEKLDEKKYNRE